MKKIVMSGMILVISIAMLMTACKKEQSNNDDDNGRYNNQQYPSTAHVIRRAVTDVDGNIYDAVQIGNQVWMAENLCTSHYADGTSIPKGKFGVDGYDSMESPFFYIPYNTQGSNHDYVPLYGYLYNWPAVMHGASSSNSNPSRVQGVCPDGWHVPSDAEWTELENCVKSNSLYYCGDCDECVAKALAGTKRWSSSSKNCAVGNNISSNNTTGFSAFPTGYYQPYYYGTDGNYAVFWSCTLNGGPDVFYLAYDDSNVQRGPFFEDMGVPVRCIRD